MILIAMMLIVILTIMGITSTTTSVVENRIAVNEQLHKMSFFHADSGIYATPKVIRAIMREGDDVSAPDMDGSIYYLLFDDDDDQLIQSDDGEHFFDQIMGYQGYDDGTADIGYEVAVGGVDREVRVDVKRIGSFHVAGGGVEFASGADGIGSGGGKVRYGFFSVGSVPGRGSSSSVHARYRYVPSIPGGL